MIGNPVIIPFNNPKCTRSTTTPSTIKCKQILLFLLSNILYPCTDTSVLSPGTALLQCITCTSERDSWIHIRDQHRYPSNVHVPDSAGTETNLRVPVQRRSNVVGVFARKPRRVTARKVPVCALNAIQIDFNYTGLANFGFDTMARNEQGIYTDREGISTSIVLLSPPIDSIASCRLRSHFSFPCLRARRAEKQRSNGRLGRDSLWSEAKRWKTIRLECQRKDEQGRGAGAGEDYPVVSRSSGRALIDAASEGATSRNESVGCKQYAYRRALLPRDFYGAVFMNPIGATAGGEPDTFHNAVAAADSPNTFSRVTTLSPSDI